MNYFSVLVEQQQAQPSPMESDTVLQAPKKVRTRGVAFKVSPQVMAPPRTLVRRPAVTSAPPAQRKAVYRSQLDKPKAVPMAVLPTAVDFPQLTQPGRIANLGIWVNTTSIHAAVSLPDPMIAIKAARDAEAARIRALVNMYNDVVHLDECDLDDHVIDAIEAKREQAAAVEAREAKKKQPQRRRHQELGDDEDEIAHDETYIIGNGQLLVQAPEVEEPPMPRRVRTPEPEHYDSESEYEDWEKHIVSNSRGLRPANGGSWWDED